MARKQFKPDQIVAILREAERGADLQVLFPKHGICQKTVLSMKADAWGVGRIRHATDQRPGGREEVCSFDFVHDRIELGQKIKLLRVLVVLCQF